MNYHLAVVIVSSSVGKSPRDIIYSFVFDEIFRLAQRGLKVHVVRSKVEEDSILSGIYFHGIKRKFDPMILNTLLRNSREFRLLSWLRNPARIYWESLYALNISRVIKKNDVGLIHAHFAYPEGLAGLLAKRMTDKPLIVTVHGYDILTEESVKYGLRLNKNFDAIIKWVLNEADAVITSSNATFKEARKIISAHENIYLIPNGVDVQRFNPHLNGSYLKEKLKIGEDKVVFTLRHHELKYGIEFLIKAAPLVLRERNRNNVMFVVGGDGPLRNYHEKLAEKLNIKDKVIFTGRIPQDEVPYYYSMSDIVVVPSLQEAFGLVVSEAMACGKPVIGTNVGGIPDQIIDGYNGFLVKPRSPEDIAEKIIWLLENQEEAKVMGMRGRKIVEEKFNIERKMDRIIELYKSLLS
ncbi:MAG: glycosyltransferase [Candidatus Bathyarchaeia archaeon]